MSQPWEQVKSALQGSQTIDITTTGRQSGDARRLEIVIHNLDGRFYISGIPLPNRRSWLANVDADPHMTVHLKGKMRADLPATARVIDDEAERRAVLPHIARIWGRKDLEKMVEQSPLVEVTLER
ncbi:MAG: nitroreductase family deazaflavin-dependent oxidoreductase [Candidatus Dormibacteraceae bacterium]